MIYCVGDSHICLFNGGFFQSIMDGSQGFPKVFPGKEGFKTGYLGPLLAYSFFPGRIEFRRVCSYFGVGSKVLFSLGEIDCRRHLLKQSVDGNRALIDVIEDCVFHYGSAISLLKSKGLFVGVLGPHCPPVSEGVHGSVGALEVRRQIVALFNEKLRDFCEDHGVVYFSMFGAISSLELENERVLYDEAIHLSGFLLDWIGLELRDLFFEV